MVIINIWNVYSIPEIWRIKALGLTESTKCWGAGPKPMKKSFNNIKVFFNQNLIFKWVKSLLKIRSHEKVIKVSFHSDDIGLLRSPCLSPFEFKEETYANSFTCNGPWVCLLLFLYLTYYLFTTTIVGQFHFSVLLSIRKTLTIMLDGANV